MGIFFWAQAWWEELTYHDDALYSGHMALQLRLHQAWVNALGVTLAIAIVYRMERGSTDHAEDTVATQTLRSLGC